MKELVNLSKNEIIEVANTLAIALENDPLYVYLFEDIDCRKKFLKEFFIMRVKYGLKYGKVYSAADDLKGITIILPGEDTMTPTKVLKSGGLKLIMKFGKKTIDNMEYIMSVMKEVQDKNIDYPFVHISPIGVNPQFQGRGYAKLMLEGILKDLDESNLGCYLETQNSDNVQFYKKFGFELIEKGIVANTKLEYFCMERRL